MDQQDSDPSDLDIGIISRSDFSEDEPPNDKSSTINYTDEKLQQNTQRKSRFDKQP